MCIKIRILIVEDNPRDVELLEYELKKGRIEYVSEVVQNEAGYKNALKNFIPDIILSDYLLPLFDGRTAFRIREQIAPDTPFIFVSGTIGEENSIGFIRNGVTDYALKDKLFTLTTKIRRALKESKEKDQKYKTEQVLVQSEKRLARAQQIAHMGNWELNFTTQVVFCSDEVGRIYVLPPGQNQESFENWQSFVHPEDLDYVMKANNESQPTSMGTRLNHRIILKNGTIKQIYSESKVEFDSEGKPVGLYGIVHDVTERRVAETERLKMLNDLMLRNKDLEQFAYIVSHNLRAPIANILGAANILNAPGLSTERKNTIWPGLIESVKGLDNIIKDLNSILQVKSTINEKKDKVCFSELVDDIKISIKNSIATNGIEIKYDFSEIDELFTFKTYLYSIFYNLISNSIKYRQQQLPGIIEIKSHLSDDKIVLVFTDNGMGIDLHKRGDQVFGLYKRFHTNIEGKGVGLFMIKTQVEALDGKISIKSEVNKGTEFRIEFEK